MNTLYSNIKIHHEDLLRDELSKQLKKHGLEEIPKLSQKGYNSLIISQLKDGVELIPKTHSRLFQIIQEVCDVLDLKINVRLFKGKEFGGAENVAIFSYKNNIILTFYNDILNLVDDDELKFIIGHELGHYIFGHTEIYTEGGIIELLGKPQLSKSEKKLFNSADWDFILDLSCLIMQLAELNADKIGLIASKNLQVSTTASIKLTSGLFDRFGVYQPEYFLEQAEQLIKDGDYFSEGDLRLTHPAFSIRTYALSKFYHSHLFTEYRQHGKTVFDRGLFKPSNSPECSSDLNEIKKYVPIDLFEELNKGKLNLKLKINLDEEVEIDPATKTISTENDFQFEKNMFLYIALIEVSAADGKLTSAERRFISSCIRDKECLSKILDFYNEASDADLKNKFLELVPIIKKLPAISKTSIIKNLIKVAKADRKIYHEEIDRILEIADQIDATEQAKAQLKNLMGVMIEN